MPMSRTNSTYIPTGVNTLARVRVTAHALAALLFAFAALSARHDGRPVLSALDLVSATIMAILTIHWMRASHQLR